MLHLHRWLNRRPSWRLGRDRRGATAIEYGLIAALIAVAAIAAMQGVGTSLKKTFGNVSTKLNTSVT